MTSPFPAKPRSHVTPKSCQVLEEAAPRSPCVWGGSVLAPCWPPGTSSRPSPAARELPPLFLGEMVLWKCSGDSFYVVELLSYICIFICLLTDRIKILLLSRLHSKQGSRAYDPEVMSRLFHRLSHLEPLSYVF